MNQWTEDEIKDVIQKTIAKANNDVEFRKLCLENSKEAIQQMTEKEIPEDFPLKFVENESSTIVMLPAFGTPEGELCDDDLEKVAGGGKSFYECLEDLFHPGRSAAVASAAVVVPAAGVVPLAGVGAGTAVAAAVAAGVAGAANGPTVK